MLYIITAIITIILDQLSKYAVIQNLKISESIPILGKILYFTHVTNKGGAFGLFSEFPGFFVVLAVLLIIVGFAMTPKILKLSTTLQVGLGLLFGGTVGNLIDRLRFGSVIDFIDFKVWPTFNIADIAICVGVGLLAYHILVKEYNDEKNKDLPEESEEDNDSKNSEKMDLDTANL
ncbi:MAG: signal peptidase II [Candidatus Eremiobacteraeota bacterium]|nr:signal peptidase II [Candidatus Eremiobacteraeota bacterium]